MTEKPLTGWHVLAIFVTAFSIIISVNLALAYNAVATFPGLDNKTKYIAGHGFNGARDAQEALGWQVEAVLQDNTLTLRIDDAAGPVVPHLVTTTLGRATHPGDDRSPDFRHDGQAFVAAVPDADRGNWQLRLEARAADGTQFRQRLIVDTPR